MAMFADIVEYDELLTETEVVSSHLKITWFSKDDSTGHNEREQRTSRQKKRVRRDKLKSGQG